MIKKDIIEETKGIRSSLDFFFFLEFNDAVVKDPYYFQGKSAVYLIHICVTKSHRKRYSKTNTQTIEQGDEARPGRKDCAA